MFSLLQSFLQSIPKSVKYILFLVFILIILAILPFFLHIFGYHCNSEKQIIKTSIAEFNTNLKLATTSGEEFINLSEYNPSTSIISVDCMYEINYTGSGDKYEECFSYSTNCIYVLRYSPKLFSTLGRCISCVNRSYLYITSKAGTNLNGYYCLGDAYRLNESDMDEGWFQDTCNSDCVMPEGYYYRSSTGTFVCSDFTVCGNATQTAKKVLDVLLDQADGKRYYPLVVNDKDYNSAVKLKCDNNYDPQITVFGVPLFDYRLWILLYMVGIMFFFYVKYLKK
jgi:hypothetical protein